MKSILSSLTRLALPVLVGSATMAGNVSSATAAPISLPSESMVYYKRVTCAQLSAGDAWIPGAPTKAGQFLRLDASLKSLKVRAARAPSRSALKKSLQKQVKALQKRLTNELKVCADLGTGYVPPKTAQSPAPGATTILWTDDLANLGVVTQNVLPEGQDYSYFCPAISSPDAVYGSMQYTYDSSICNAAVHAGVIRRRFGGNVRLRVKGAATLFPGSVRNGITSSSYGPFRGSYVFLNPKTGAELTTVAPWIIDWRDDLAARSVRDRQDLVSTLLCPSQGTPDTIYGTDVYTDDSSICTAAVHAGKISLKAGGVVNVRASAGVTVYTSTRRNGILSTSYGAWSGSLVFE
jgi:hypothetical protein